MSNNNFYLSTESSDGAIELPVLKSTVGQDVIDIAKVPQTGCFTIDAGFGVTASCESKITFIDGGKGILLHRGYPIDQLANNSDFLETCFLLINGELPSVSEKETFLDEIKKYDYEDLYESEKNNFIFFNAIK